MMTPSMMESRIEIYENERAWIGGGFSKKGLLPNDRGRFSTIDGSLSWKTLEEAQEALLLKGWKYDVEQSEFELEAGSPEWLYARDFTQSAVAHSQSQRGALHWVRFRRLSRPIRLQPFDAIPREVVQKCQHGDSRAVEGLANKMVDVLAYMTLVQSPSVLTDAAAVPAKRQIMDLLEDVDKFGSVATTPLSRTEAVHVALEQLAEVERNSPKRLFSNVGAFYQRTRDPGWETRRLAVAERYWPEREIVAGWMVRALDKTEFELHCDKEQCGDACEFCRVQCPNEGCPDVMSRKYVSMHDDKCSFKVIECECGDSYPRHQEQHHLEDVCPLRDAKCPFAKIGCATVLQAKDIPSHVAEDTSSHLLLTLDRVMEVQSVVRNMNGKIQHLEAENTQLRQALEVFREGAAKEAQTVDKKVTALGKKVSTLENSSRKEFKRIRDHSRERARSHVK